MIDLWKYEAYFDSLMARIPAIRQVRYVTSEGEMGEWLSDIGGEHQPFLMVVVPSGKTSGSDQDNVEETNYGLAYLLCKTDRQTRRAFVVQKELQATIEAIKELMIADKEGCGVMRGLDVGSFHTDPENMQLSARTAGWSVSFTIKS